MVGITSGSRRIGRQMKRWTDCIMADSGISLVDAAALCRKRNSRRNFTHRFIGHPPEVGSDLTAHKERYPDFLISS